jgi:hypothetical protein
MDVSISSAYALFDSMIQPGADGLGFRIELAMKGLATICRELDVKNSRQICGVIKVRRFYRKLPPAK